MEAELVCERQRMENSKNLIHLFVTVLFSCFASLVVNPAITDVTMAAVCPGKDECSLAIYLTGLQQTITGLGSVFVMPLIGTLSDAYGRKKMLTIPLTLSIIPFVTLAIRRSTRYFYVYYILKTLTSMIGDSAIMCLSLSYLADNVAEAKRVSAFGLLAGVVSAATVCGTLAARLLPTAQIFQVATVASITALVYMRIFLEDTTRHIDALEQPILETASGTNEVAQPRDKKVCIKRIPFMLKDIINLVTSSVTVSLASFVTFFNSLADAGSQNFLMYYLKARFGFQKNEFAEIWLITYIGATISNVLLIPTLGPLWGEEILLCIGLFAGFLNMLLNSIAWSYWVPYAAAALGIFISLASASIRCIISKQVGPCQQGIAQGCLMGIVSLANSVSPVIYSPLSALFLSEAAPFNFPGFSILCIGLAWLVAFLLSTVIKILPFFSRGRDNNLTSTVA